MSSDYGSDILSDDIAAIENASPEIVRPPATPRNPLKSRDVNVLATPPSSEIRKNDESLEMIPRASARTSRLMDKYNPQPSISKPTPATPCTPLQRRAATSHNTLPSSQLLPTPLTNCATPSSSFPPRLSQPTPSRQMNKSRPSSATRPLRGSHPDVTVTQPMPSTQNLDAPLYRFPFGKYQGKTLLDVPENYIAFLRIDQVMAESMPGFC
jgi:hypothetical protein